MDREAFSDRGRVPGVVLRVRVLRCMAVPGRARILCRDDASCVAAAVAARARTRVGSIRAAGHQNAEGDLERDGAGTGGDLCDLDYCTVASAERLYAQSSADGAHA